MVAAIELSLWQLLLLLFTIFGLCPQLPMFIFKLCSKTLKLQLLVWVVHYIRPLFSSSKLIQHPLKKHAKMGLTVGTARSSACHHSKLQHSPPAHHLQASLPHPLGWFRVSRHCAAIKLKARCSQRQGHAPPTLLFPLPFAFPLPEPD